MIWLVGCLARADTIPLEPQPPEQPNLLLISIDGLRADRMSLYGAERKTTPNLDRLAPEAMVGDAAFSSSNESALSHAVMLTGRYVPEIAWPDYTEFLVPDEALTVAEALSQVGYATGGFLAGGHVRSDFGFAQGFSTFEESDDFGSFRETVPPALAWIEQQEGPWFAMVHGYDLHRPYAKAGVLYHSFDARDESLICQLCRERNQTERIFDGVYLPQHVRSTVEHHSGKVMSDPTNYARGAELDASQGTRLSSADLDHMRAHYDSGILAADFYVGALIDELKRTGAWDDTLVIITSDHGEDLQDHGVSNHRALIHDSTTRVPFIVTGGALSMAYQGKRTDLLIDGTDVVPTLMRAAGTVSPAGTHGRNVLGLGTPGVVFQQGVTGQSAIRTPTHRLVFEGVPLTDPDYRTKAAAGPVVLYDLRSDPGETRDVAKEQVETTAVLHAMLNVHLGAMEYGTSRLPQSLELIEMLHTRGYW
ncbi:MAG: sulfatase-like hydrolase/transferase [Proteobacteria bacterium]|nr:sulfatase-like hydrolase/transferase [Pseudomonadota bacterium]